MPRVAFGDEELSFELEPNDALTEVEPSDDVSEWDTDLFYRRLDEAGFADVISGGKVLVVVNDAFRPTPSGFVLSQIKKRYPDFDADFIIACGNHPAPSDEEVRNIFSGFELGADVSVFHHDSRNYDEMIEAGRAHGYPIYVNKRIFEYPAVITIGSVEPHYFAGFTGGRKSIIPGLSDIETNRRNHAMAVSMDAQPLRLRGNPVAEDFDLLLEAVGLDNLSSIQIVTGRGQKIVDSFTGKITDAFRQAIPVAESVYAYKVKTRFDLVIAEVHPPLDRNLYQLQKAVENNHSVVVDNGTILAVSKCSEGIGNNEFYHLAGKLETEEMVLSRAEMDNPPMGIHKLSRIIEMSRRIRVKALTGLKQEILEQVFWEPAVSIEAEMQKLRSNKDNLNILLVRDAGLLVAKLDV